MLKMPLPVDKVEDTLSRKPATALERRRPVSNQLQPERGAVQQAGLHLILSMLHISFALDALNSQTKIKPYPDEIPNGTYQRQDYQSFSSVLF